ncbi:MAG: sulfotransferase [Desulfobacteraceae bacterium]|nr:sulfotransferase [Desulfobacteraceae bacterium]
MVSKAKPFIYIAALRRTGSTVISEALTLLPYSFIFREPKLCAGRFKLKPGDNERFGVYGIDLEVYKARWMAQKDRSVLEGFKYELLPKVTRDGLQVGVKEIVHRRWREYFKHFPNMKIVLTARDPRDIYISVYHRAKQGLGRYAQGLFPSQLAKELMQEFEHQLEMVEVTDCLKVKYESFCTDPSTFELIKTFTGSEIPNVGEVGHFNATNPKRRHEADLHGEQITMKRVNRWKTEKDQTLLHEAQKTFDMMTEYCEFWGYE